jgi:hypothetical protein
MIGFFSECKKTGQDDLLCRRPIRFFKDAQPGKKNRRPED